VIVVDYFYFGKNFATTEFIYFMSEIIGCCISLQSELQLSDYFLFNGYLNSNVRNRNRIIESTLNLNKSIYCGPVIDISFDFVNCFNDVFNRAKDALASHHVTDGE
jgi:hypothetical protein